MKPNPYEDLYGNLELAPATPSLLTPSECEALKSPYPWLADVINLIAFGGPPSKPETMPGGLPNFEKIPRRRQAAAYVLFRAARGGKVKFVGSPKEDSDASDAIPAHYFDFRRALGHADSSIETDLRSIPMNNYRAAREGRRQTWWNVRIEKASLVACRKSELPAEIESKAALAGPTDDDVRVLIRDAIEASGINFISQTNGAKIVRKKYPGYNKHRAMALVKKLTQNTKRGPRGPLNNCPA